MGMIEPNAIALRSVNGETAAVMVFLKPIGNLDRAEIEERFDELPVADCEEAKQAREELERWA